MHMKTPELLKDISLEQIELCLKQNSEDTDRAMRAFFAHKCREGELGIIMEAEEYSLLGAGKRVRAFLVNECCRMLGGRCEASIPFAIAVEMIHTYSLIHDDLPCMDDDDMRRGKPSNHKKFGEANALLAGDALLTNAFYAAAQNRELPPSTVCDAVAAISKAAGDEGMIGGQITDLESEGKEKSFEELLALHSLKTGRMIELSALLGCMAAGYDAQSEQTQRICAYARKIGLAFQAVDDLLDIMGNEEIVGKTLSSDAENKKTTFLSFFGAEEVREYAELLTKEAINEIATLKNNENLVALAAYLLVRNK